MIENDGTIRIYEESHSGWRPRPNVTGEIDIVDANGWPLATLHYDYRYTSNSTNHFRSNLLSGAPELLEAAKLSLKRLTELNRDDESGMRIVLANAIAKIEGNRTERVSGER